MKGEGSSAGVRTVRNFSQETPKQRAKASGGKVYKSKRIARKRPRGNNKGHILEKQIRM